MKTTLLFILLFVSGIGFVSAQAQDCCQVSGMKKNCMKYCQKSPKHCQKFCEKYCENPCTEGCCTETDAFKSAIASFPPMDTCHTFGRMNSHMGMMSVYRFYCLDTTNFSVRSMKNMPYNCMGSDSMWFEVCLYRHDGRTYSTEVRVVTSQGELSFPITMQALVQSVVESNEPILAELLVYPNPTANVLQLSGNPAINELVTAQIIDATGNIKIEKIIFNNGVGTLNASGLPSGAYQLILVSAAHAKLGIANFIVVK